MRYGIYFIKHYFFRFINEIIVHYGPAPASSYYYWPYWSFFKTNGKPASIAQQRLHVKWHTGQWRDHLELWRFAFPPWGRLVTDTIFRLNKAFSFVLKRWGCMIEQTLNHAEIIAEIVILSFIHRQLLLWLIAKF